MFSDVVAHIHDELKQIEAYMAEIDQERIKHIQEGDTALEKLEVARAEHRRLEGALKALQAEDNYRPSEGSQLINMVREPENTAAMPYLPGR